MSNEIYRQDQIFILGLYVNIYNKTKVLKTSYINIFSTFIIAGEEGIEPPLTVLETAALPLYYSPIVSAPDYRCITNEIDYTTGHSCLASKILFFYALYLFFRVHHNIDRILNASDTNYLDPAVLPAVLCTDIRDNAGSKAQLLRLRHSLSRHADRTNLAA